MGRSAGMSLIFTNTLESSFVVGQHRLSSLGRKVVKRDHAALMLNPSRRVG
jgi:hypothetical protein